MVTNSTHDHPPALMHIPLSYTNVDSEQSALRLVYAIEPKWREDKGSIEISKFTDGITNTVSVDRRPSYAKIPLTLFASFSKLSSTPPVYQQNK